LASRSAHKKTATPTIFCHESGQNQSEARQQELPGKVIQTQTYSYVGIHIAHALPVQVCVSALVHTQVGKQKDKKKTQKRAATSAQLRAEQFPNFINTKCTRPHLTAVFCLQS